MRPTIKDVAIQASVSTATVSLALHDNKRISTATKNKVLKAVKELNYYPSRSAQDLVGKRSGNIGFILTDDRFLRTEPFYTRIFLGTEFAAGDNDYYVLLKTIKTDFKTGDLIPRFILERSIDGIIIAGKVPDVFIDEILKYNLPIVLIDYQTPNHPIPSVTCDNIQGGITATMHLINQGHKSIAFIGGDVSHPSISDRLIGYKKALTNASLSVDKELIITTSESTDRQGGYNSAKVLFSKNKNITAIYACNDAMAIGVMHFAKDNNIKIPEDISLIGFDDVEADLLIDPPLTTIRVPKIDLGMEAVQLLINNIKTKNQSHKKILVPVELIVRESTKKYMN
jgi:LacI family transcriptional regulator, galactose operon repressor